MLYPKTLTLTLNLTLTMTLTLSLMITVTLTLTITLTLTLMLTLMCPWAECRVVFGEIVFQGKYPNWSTNCPLIPFALHTIFKQMVGPRNLPHSKIINQQKESKWDLSVDDRKGRIKRRKNRGKGAWETHT